MIMGKCTTSVLLLLLLCSCSNAMAVLETNERIWLEEYNLTNYQLLIQLTCMMCDENLLAPVVVSVRGTSVDARYLRSGEVVPDNLKPRLALTVDDLFDYIRDGLTDPGLGVTADYDPMRGYPTHVHRERIGYMDTGHWYQVLLLSSSDWRDNKEWPANKRLNTTVEPVTHLATVGRSLELQKHSQPGPHQAARALAVVR